MPPMNSLSFAVSDSFSSGVVAFPNVADDVANRMSSALTSNANRTRLSNIASSAAPAPVYECVSSIATHLRLFCKGLISVASA